MGNWYEKQMNDFIREAERRKEDSMEDFCRGLKDARNVLDERLSLSLDELEPEVAAEIFGGG